VLAAPFPALPATADAGQSVEAGQEKLKQLRARIAQLTARLGEQLTARDALRARLRQSELEITEKRRHLDALRSEESAAERNRAQLRAEEIGRRAALEGERALLAGQVRAAYLIGREESLKLLLNQQDPASAGRMIAYYGYFSRRRAAELTAIDTDVRRLQQVGQDLEAQAAALKALQAAAAVELGELVKARAERSAVLTALGDELKNANDQLAGLKREEQSVEALLQDLARVLQDFPVDSRQPFEALRGKLPWPVAGRLATHYQDLRLDSTQGAIRWNGVLIETTPGSKVRAPYFGRVVYADWLQGLGLLIILAHSGGYMTLYGHTEVLYKSVGDWVSPGDVIAALGDTAGAPPPRLYFEIRQGRKPVDPKLWMKGAP
jgi:septal ring factor EnvC (AmiA/AmiB activator)